MSSETTFVEKRKTLAPKLRFKEFRTDWPNKTLEDVAVIARGKSRHRPRDASFLYGGPYPFIQTGDIRTADLYIISFTQTYSEEGLKQSRLWDEGTLCITIAANIAETAILKIKACFPDSVIGLLPKGGESDTLFIKYLFDKFKIEIQSLSQGLAQANLNLEKLSSLKFSIPSLPEQQKIASFLSAVDEKIQQLTRKKELLEQYKKGVMQQLFSGKLSFKDENGKAYPKWEARKLGEILDYLQPSKYLVESTEYDDSFETPVLTAGKTFILGYTNETFNIYGEKLPVIIFDDFTTGIQFVDFPFKAKSSAMKILVAKESENISFIFNAMQLVKFEVGGHGRHWISQYSQIAIPYPCLKEQRKIASFLSHIDSKIESVSKQIEQTQAFKKGLLQQMFI